MYVRDDSEPSRIDANHMPVVPAEAGPPLATDETLFPPFPASNMMLSVFSRRTTIVCQIGPVLSMYITCVTYLLMKGLDGGQASLRGACSRSRTEPKYIGDVSSKASRGSSGKCMGDRQMRERGREGAGKAKGCKGQEGEKEKESVRS